MEDFPQEGSCAVKDVPEKGRSASAVTMRRVIYFFAVILVLVCAYFFMGQKKKTPPPVRKPAVKQVQKDHIRVFIPMPK